MFTNDKVDKNGKVVRFNGILTAELGWARNRLKKISPILVLTGLVNSILLLWCVRLKFLGNDEILDIFGDSDGAGTIEKIF